jgi:hypothetical protein
MARDVDCSKLDSRPIASALSHNQTLEACGDHYTYFSTVFVSCKNRPQVVCEEVALVSKLYV